MSTAVSNVQSETVSDIELWKDEYEAAIRNPPGPGTILRTIDGSDAVLTLDFSNGKEPFISARAYVSSIVGQTPGWHLFSDAQEAKFGLRCILLPKARDAWFQRHGTKSEIGFVTALRVIRPSQSGMALVCEIAEFADING